jgi:hypothetical protein
VMTNKNYLFACSLWFKEQVLIPVVKKINHPGSGKIYPGSGSRIQGVKKHRIRNSSLFSTRYKISMLQTHSYEAQCLVQNWMRLLKIIIGPIPQIFYYFIWSRIEGSAADPWLLHPVLVSDFQSDLTEK